MDCEGGGGGAAAGAAASGVGGCRWPSGQVPSTQRLGSPEVADSQCVCAKALRNAEFQKLQYNQLN
ncbi:uncharacterized protein LOC27208480 [Drosophila simulans]|uniref:uncharacterized protein LOC27208480 n=1 Tax=Drosophila simulans TaxID=7240 RepID=UPI00192CEA94|nr:uncharacterized protein LOC27208480 [Drosophila simulans]